MFKSLFAILLFSNAFAIVEPSEESYILYLDRENVERVGNVKKEIYREIVKSFPICCVDTFVYDPTHQVYLMVLRVTPPAEGKWWIPGGRVYKGESLYECATRKSKDEIGFTITPIAQLGTYSTLFSESAWDCQTHTINTAILAIVTDSSSVNLDKHCDAIKWNPIDVPPEDPYMVQVYQEAITFLHREGLKNP